MKLQKLAAGARAFPSLHFRKGPGIEVVFDERYILDISGRYGNSRHCTVLLYRFSAFPPIIFVSMNTNTL